jgi:outer membrane receptor protein involved in Fe transport
MLKTMAIRSSLLAFACAISLSAHAFADAPKRVDVPAGDLTLALQKLADQSGVEFIYSADQLRGLRTSGVHGEYTTEEAVAKLLEGTKLKLSVHDGGVLLISDLQASGTATGVAPAQPPARMAAVEQASSVTAESTEDSSASSPASTVEEIVVTAQKRVERLQEVPVPVTAISGDALVDSNQLRLQDYFTRIPGLSFFPGIFGEPVITIRGVTAAYGTNPTVGIVVDDVPYGSSTSRGGGYQAADIDPGDLARVEVLRGPQGTLYGSSSIGGLLKYVTVEPSTEGMSGDVQGGLSSVHNGDELGYNVRAAVNVPLSETLAFRVSGFTRRDPGYIDDPTLALQSVNWGKAEGGRLSALWKPSEDFSLKLNALLQSKKLHGSSVVNLEPGLGDLEQRALRGSGLYDKTSDVYSLTLKTNLGPADLTALSGYTIDHVTDVLDQSSVYRTFTQSLFGVAGGAQVDDRKTTKFSQELRLSMPLGTRVEWLFGGFYTDERTPHWQQNVFGVDPATGISAGALIFQDITVTYEEYAAFTDLTFKITDRFDVQVGGRQSEGRQTYAKVSSGPFAGARPIIPTIREDESAFTYLVTPRFRISPHLMAYARLASGFRPGGPNSNCLNLGVPCEYGPDKTQNYEVGVKGEVLDHALSFDASLYYIDWKDIQLLVSRGFSFFENANRAKSQGVELSLESRPLSGLTLAGWIAYGDAKLTEGFPAGSTAFASSGDRLPFSSRVSGNFSVDQHFPLASSVTGFIGGSVSYVGDREGSFAGAAVAPRQNFPSYTQTDVRAGVKYDAWTVNAFVNNVTDRRGILSGDPGIATAIYYIQPRTIGLSLGRTF